MYVVYGDDHRAQVQFYLPQGNVTDIGVVAPFGSTLVATHTVFSNGATSTLSSLTSVAGTRESAVCSNRGDCDYSTGACMCYAGFASSDGRGSSGTRGDCGYKAVSNQTYYNVNGSAMNTLCPVKNHLLCSGHGTCTQSTGLCSCSSGYSAYSFTLSLLQHHDHSLIHSFTRSDCVI